MFRDGDVEFEDTRGVGVGLKGGAGEGVGEDVGQLDEQDELLVHVPSGQYLQLAATHAKQSKTSSELKRITGFN